MSELKNEIRYQRAVRILQNYEGWLEDIHDPPSLREGYRRPSNSDIDWARAVIALRQRGTRRD